MKMCALCDDTLNTEEQIWFGLCGYHSGKPTPQNIAIAAEIRRIKKFGFGKVSKKDRE